MSETAVCDASATVAMLLDSGAYGQWATAALSGAELLAPSLMKFESSNIIRRQELASLVSGAEAAQAHVDLVELSIEEWPYDLLATRVRELRRNLTAYDASYVAVAEMTDSPLVTLDRRIRRAPGVRCRVIVPEF